MKEKSSPETLQPLEAAKPQVTLQGTVRRIIYRNDEGGFTVAVLQDEASLKREVTVVGTLPGLVPGERVEVTGSWEKHKTYGYRLKVAQFRPLPPVSQVGIERYLSSGMVKGVGPSLARQIVGHFGLETLKVLDEDPERLLEVPGIGRYRMKIIREAWEAQREVRRIMMFLAEHGISTALAAKIYREYGNGALAVLRQNPYRLADDVFGIGFLTADKIARSLGVAPEEKARIEAGIRYVLSRATDDGHMYLPRKELLRRSRELLELPLEKVESVLDELIQENHLVAEGEAVYLPGFYKVEVELAQRLVLLASAPRRSQPAEKLFQELAPTLRLAGAEFSAEQKKAIGLAVEEKVLIITGGPGTGKTTVVWGILQVFSHIGLRTLLAAPTGRAAKRLSESTGEHARTIHRLLDFDPKSRQFLHNEKRPLKADAVIVDEVSMVDALLMNHLVRAVPFGAHLILVGDADQLPSVGPGNVLRDLISSGKIRTVQLTEVFRQAANSAIVLNAHRINRGLMPDLSRKQPQPAAAPRGKRLLPRDDYGDFLFVEEEDPARITRLILELCSKKLPERYGYRPLQDIQVITPIYRGELGVDNLNQLLQERLNPGSGGLPRGKVTFRRGDRVMQIRNNYTKMVFNGDLGIIRQIDPREHEILVDFDHHPVEYEFDELNELVLAYAITVHKSQGSEYPVVIMPISTHHYVMLQRNLLYTAMTRAKELMILIGTKKALALAVRNNRTVLRYTQLSRRIAAALSPPEPEKTGGKES